ncbi:MAG: serine hydrolase [Bacteroidales bacterium]
MANTILPEEGRGASVIAYQQESVDEMIYNFMKEHEIPGLTLAIVQAPYIPRVVGYGLCDIGEKRLASTNTLWAIGPLTQGYTAVAIMQLYEQDKLNIYDALGKYLNDQIPAAWQQITLFELMQHASGISDYRDNAKYDMSTAYTPKQLIEMVAPVPLLFESGTEVRQSATNFLLLAQVIERVTGGDYEDFIRKYQIEYLGLKETCFSNDLSRLITEPVASNNNLHALFKTDKAYIDPAENAVGYDDTLHQQPLLPSGALKGFAGLWASARDVSLWDIALAGSVLIKKPENRALIYSATTLKSGKVVPAMAGWQFTNHNGFMDIKGSVKGFSSYLSRFTGASELVCVTLLANKENIDFTNLARRIASAFGLSMSAGVNDTILYTYESAFSVDETMARIEAQLKKAGTPVFAQFDHERNAQEVGLKMPPTRVIVFGSPLVGTHLMLEEPSFCVELPLKMAVWQDAKGSVWIAFPKMKIRAQLYGNLVNNPIIAKMDQLLANLARKAANVY